MRILFFVLLVFAACQSAPEAPVTDRPNTPAEGFNQSTSDPEAIALADEVMDAMGGRYTWDTTQNICWTFFERRRLCWNKPSGDVRIENTQDDQVILVNIHDGKGKVFKNGQEWTEADTLQKYLTMGKEAWINDAYWLVMPFKLKDSGVTLKHLGRDTIQGGAMAEVLELTFADVGVTPENRYLVYVDPDSKLVNQWSFFSTAADSVPRFSTPWAEYKTFGALKLSESRGRGKMGDIEVPGELPAATYKSF